MIHVEFFGIARKRTGTASVDLPLATPTSLGGVMHRLATCYPEFAAECLEGDRLQPGYVANLDGQRFIRDPRTPLADNVAVLIMSADAGG